MNATLPMTRVLHALLRRELAEHRMLFVYLPVVLASLGFAGFTVWLILASGPPEALVEAVAATPPSRLTSDEAQAFTRQLQGFMESWHEPFVSSWYFSVSQLMLLTFWGSMAFYYLQTLYQARKDRSILFWNSMPVSDAQTVMSKVLAGLVVCQATYMLALLALDLGMFLALHVKTALTEVQGFAFVRTVRPFINALETLITMPTSLLWAFPAYGWLLLASAWSRQSPFAWAAGPWVLIVMIEVALRDESLVFNKIAEHLLPIAIMELNASGYQTPELALGVLLGAAFVYAAIRFNRADEAMA